MIEVAIRIIQFTDAAIEEEGIVDAFCFCVILAKLSCNIDVFEPPLIDAKD